MTDAETIETAEERTRRLAVERMSKRIQTIREYISDEEQPPNIRISVVASRETEGANEIQLFTQSPYHSTVVKVPADSREGQVVALYQGGLLQHQRAVKNLGGQP